MCFSGFVQGHLWKHGMNMCRVVSQQQSLANTRWSTVGQFREPPTILVVPLHSYDMWNSCKKTLLLCFDVDSVCFVIDWYLHGCTYLQLSNWHGHAANILFRIVALLFSNYLNLKNMSACNLNARFFAADLEPSRMVVWRLHKVCPRPSKKTYCGCFCACPCYFPSYRPGKSNTTGVIRQWMDTISTFSKQFDRSPEKSSHLISQHTHWRVHKTARVSMHPKQITNSNVDF